MQVNPGELRHKIVVFNSKDIEYHNCYAAVNQMSGTEIVKNSVQFEQVVTRFLIRYTKKQISNDMTIKFNGFIYDIQYTNDYNLLHEYIEIIAIKRSYMVE